MREGLRKIIESHSDVAIAAEVAHVEEILHCDRVNCCAVGVIALPFACFWNGEFYRVLQDKIPDLPIVVITDSNNPEFVSSVMKSGIRGILGKDLVADSLIEAIREVASGKTYVGKEVAALVANRFSLFKRIDSGMRLTRREIEILKRLAIGRKVVTIGGELGISSKTVSAHKSRIMEKLALSSDTELVRYAMENQLFDLFVDHSRRKAKAAYGS
ncbi:MAG: LuxR C-terminal-related transcriptional regulator [Tumebacillaceae bacterium]